MKILLLAGEESGLIYANRLRELFRTDEIRTYADYGFETADLAVMGFAAVIRRIGFFLRVKKTMERAIDEWRPDVLCTVDYPGMNLKLAAYAKKRGVKCVHIVCPQVWAWKAGRIPRIEASLDRLCCFFPFEPGLFKSGFAEFIGHPLVEDFAKCETGSRNRKLLALLPGSRIGEIERNLPVMLESALMLQNVRIVIPAANGKALSKIQNVVKGFNSSLQIDVVHGGARDLLCKAWCAVVASGTATLEAALARCPTVLVYRVSPVLAWFARRVIKGVKHIGLANIIWEKSGGGSSSPMPELLQEDFTPSAVAGIIGGWFSSEESRNEAARRLDKAVALLATGKSAYARMVDAVKN